jgi:hypothetical protein
LWSFPEALLTVTTSAMVRIANLLELNSTNLLALILFIVRLLQYESHWE